MILLFSLSATEVAFLLSNANESSDAESQERGRDMHSYMIRKIEQCSDNPIQSSPIQSGWQKKAEKPPILSGFLTSLFFCFGKGFSTVFFFVYFGFCDDLLKLLLAIMVDKWAYGLYKKSHPLITVIYLARRRKLFLFDWSSPEIIKQNPRNAKWKVKSGKGSFVFARQKAKQRP